MNKYVKYLNEAIRSEEMVNYLKNINQLDINRIIEVIQHSPYISLSRKKEILLELENDIKTIRWYDNDERNKFVIDLYYKALNGINKAYELLDREGIFVIEEGFYDESMQDTNSEYCGIASNIDTVYKYIDYQIDEIKIKEYYDNKFKEEELEL